MKEIRVENRKYLCDLLTILDGSAKTAILRFIDFGSLAIHLSWRVGQSGPWRRMQMLIEIG